MAQSSCKTTQHGKGQAHSLAPNFPSLRAHIQDEAEQLMPARVCILTKDIFGPIRNGGIGTSYYYLAIGLAQAGHSVTIVFPSQWGDDMPLEKWIPYYKKRNINLVIAPPSPVSHSYGMDKHTRIARTAYDYLIMHDGEFDIIHSHEMGGVAYYILNAKRQGIAFQKTLFCITTHSPTMWNVEGNSRVVNNTEDIIANYMEQSCVAWADLVISPSQYMLRWCQKKGWNIDTARCCVQPHFLPEPRNIHAVPAAQMPVTELVYFGRIEERKGLEVLYRALLRMGRDLTRRTTLTFLGKLGLGYEKDAVLQKFSRLCKNCSIKDSLNREEALAYLQNDGRLALIPSLMDNSPMVICECLEQGIPFLSSDVGGISELVHKDDQALTLFSPTPYGLSHALERSLQKGVKIPRSQINYTQNAREWDLFHRSFAAQNALTLYKSSASPNTQYPLISCCIVYKGNREGLLSVLSGIAAQDYPQIEVIICIGQGNGDELFPELEHEYPSLQIRIVSPICPQLGYARNTACRLARGEYFLLHDAESLSASNLFLELYKTAQSCSADIVTCSLDCVPSDKPLESQAVSERHTFLGPCLELGLFQNCFGQGAVLVSRAVFEELGGFSEINEGVRDIHAFCVNALCKGFHLEVRAESMMLYKKDYRKKELEKEYNSKEAANTVLSAYLHNVSRKYGDIFRMAIGGHIAEQ